jgi:pyrroloquinoline quinone biosynthesis protein D
VTLGPGDSPRFAAGVRLSFDRARDRWVLLAPERVLAPDEIALAILRRCDGATTVSQMSAALAIEHAAGVDEVERDVLEMLDDLARKGLLAW